MLCFLLYGSIGKRLSAEDMEGALMCMVNVDVIARIWR
jgi:hypothetical protein